VANASKKKGASSRGNKQFPRQHQARQPGRQHVMRPQPHALRDNYLGANKLEDKTALISGGDSGIGRSVAVAFAREGADVCIVYLEEDRDAQETRRLVENEGRQCLLVRGDIGNRRLCGRAVQQTVKHFGRLDVLVNNAAEQHRVESIAELSEEQLVRTFRTNIFSFFFLTAAAVEHLKRVKGCIVNTTSVTAYRGSPGLLDYSATKGAIVAFTRSLALALVKDGVRVNAVAPGPIWTPLIPASFPAKEVATFGSDTPMGRAGDPAEVGPAYVFLASEDASYITGQVLHVNGGEIING
jgi:NAD(P)-dependent dehydrogenase (short-subunit alcohol dehydrogenase family)